MKKIGLAIVTYVNNFGSFLQSYATYEIIKKMNYEPEVIEIKGVQNIIAKARKKYFLSRVFNKNELKSYWVTINGLIRKRVDKNYKRNISMRNDIFERFCRERFVFSPVLNSWKDIGEYCEREYDSVLVGSDQLWRPANIEGDYYTLNFVPQSVNKVSYATSFGVPYLPPKQEEKAEVFLRKFNHISVRENNGKKIVKKAIGRDVPVVCDPTLLIKREEWEKVVGKQIEKEEYILCYFLGDNQIYPQFAKKMSDTYKIKNVGLIHCAGYNKNTEKYYDETPFDVGPFEFLNLVKHAKYVFTDSFHCCVFSIIFNKEFYAFKRFADEDEMSTNDRLVTLFSSLNITGRVLDGTEKLEDFKKIKNIDYVEVEKKLEDIRKNSIDYLENALNLEK